MPSFVRALLWVAVVIAPGGFLLLPFLAARALRERSQGVAAPLLTRP